MQKECIPVGYVPSAAVAISCQAHPPAMHNPPAMHAPPAMHTLTMHAPLCHTCPLPHMPPLHHTCTPLPRMLHLACMPPRLNDRHLWNITFPQLLLRTVTSVLKGNLYEHHWKTNFKFLIKKMYFLEFCEGVLNNFLVVLNTRFKCMKIYLEHCTSVQRSTALLSVHTWDTGAFCNWMHFKSFIMRSL